MFRERPVADEAKGAEGTEGQGDKSEGLVEKNKELLGELKAERAKRKDLEKALGGLDLDAAREAIEFKANADEEQAKRRGEFDKLRERDKAAYDKKLAEREAREAKLTKALHARLVDYELDKAIRAEGGDPEYVLEKGRPRVTVVETDEGWDVVVAGPDGKPASMGELAKELRERFPKAFDGSGSSGSGARAGAGGGATLPDPNDPKAVGLAADAWLKARQKTA